MLSELITLMSDEKKDKKKKKDDEEDEEDEMENKSVVEEEAPVMEVDVAKALLESIGTMTEVLAQKMDILIAANSQPTQPMQVPQARGIYEAPPVQQTAPGKPVSFAELAQKTVYGS